MKVSLNAIDVPDSERCLRKCGFDHRTLIDQGFSCQQARPIDFAALRPSGRLGARVARQRDHCAFMLEQAPSHSEPPTFSCAS